MASCAVGMLVSAPRCFISRILSNPAKCLLPVLHNSRNASPYTSSRVLLCTSSRHLAERRYSKKHEWMSVEGKTGTIGVSHYAQESLGDVVYVQLPEVDTEYSQDDECGAVESVKAASEIYTPASGKVTEVNTALEDNPALVNQSCYDKGWLFRMELSKPQEYNDLLTEEQYDKYLKTLE